MFASEAAALGSETVSGADLGSSFALARRRNIKNITPKSSKIGNAAAAINKPVLFVRLRQKSVGCSIAGLLASSNSVANISFLLTKS